MSMKAAKHLVKIIAAFALIVLGAVSLNAAAAVINPATGDAEFGGSLAQTRGNVMDIDIRVDEPTAEGRLANEGSASDSDLLGQVLDSDIVSTSVVPLPAAAWMFGAALFGLLSIARRRQTNKS
ncbi:VPLPA-CTERM sorting domain-containing protein [Halioglobus sp. Uisw_031]|jgi:hypothetical protein|uniref:VPLPA-CTERM sorting domain-containing protein n=1 Tax=Halioglobus sp. Uisw_031 TaxID=3230977 RepID=UPI0039EBCF3D|tara:strand:- start:87 stop:458 length:372 start_codon:yes stop_codon:yes gene_type:complete